MKRFEMVFVIIAMWVGAEVGSEIGIDNWGLLLAVLAYVVIAEIVARLFKKFGVRIIVDRKEG